MKADFLFSCMPCLVQYSPPNVFLLLFPSAGSGRVQLYYPASRLDRPPTSSNASHGVYRRRRPLKLTSFESLEERNVNDIKKISQVKDELFWCHVRKDDQTWPRLLPRTYQQCRIQKGKKLKGLWPKATVTSCSGNRAGLYYNAFTVDWTEPRWKS